MRARDMALEVLNHLDKDPVIPQQYLERAFKQDQRVTKRDRALTYNLVQGVLRWRIRFDWIIKQSARFSFKKIDLPVLNVLRIALCQIYFMDRIPQSAAVNEAVKQVKAIAKAHTAGFVNGILRQICRNKHKISFPDREKDVVQYLSVYYSYPSWLVKKWIRELGIDSAERLLDAGNRISDLVVRTNRLKIDRAALIDHLKKEDVTAIPTFFSPEGVRLEGFKGQVVQLDAFRKGWFQVQGEAAQICSYLLNPRPDESVLDICAGLGGKSTHIAELMEDKGRVLSLDISFGRLAMLLESSLRLGITSIQAIAADTSKNLSWLKDGSFDKVLVDGPCSGLGVISKHPDAKWTKNKNDIKRLSLLQTQIMNEAVSLLNNGGKLLYVTCTISREENEGVANEFLRKNKGMFLENLKDYAPEWGLEFIDDQGFFKTLPHVNGMDGFFAALFSKQA